MSRKNCGLALRAWAVGILMLTAVVAGQILFAPTVQAQRARALNRSRVQRWEYCAIINVAEIGRAPVTSDFKFNGMVELCYFSNSGCRRLRIEGDTREEAVAKAIAKLGDDGWEMASDSSFPVMANSINGLFFKRPKR